jgi:hypothetical protein
MMPYDLSKARMHRDENPVARVASRPRQYRRR